MITASHLLLISTTPCAPCDAPQSSRVTALRMWLDSWSGIGRAAVGMHRQGFDLQLTEYDERGWRATFHTTGWSIRARRASHGSAGRGFRGIMASPSGRQQKDCAERGGAPRHALLEEA